jgi:hopanoid biosynthesis associated radical SAM protein HpnJ
MRTLFLNPPSFEGFDGGAGSRWPASREIESYWYPVWLCYPAGMLPDSKVVDAPPHKISIEQTVEMAKQFELLVLFTSTPGFHVDVQMAEMMKDSNPKLKVAFVGPPVTVEPEKTLRDNSAIDFLVRREFDYQIADYANGKPLEELPGVSFRKNGDVIHNPEAPAIENLDALPWVTKTYKRDLDITRYNVPFLLNPFVAFYTSRGCPALCTFCLWPQTHSGHRWRLRSSADVAAEARYAFEQFPNIKEIFFDDDTFNYRKDRTLDLCKHLKPLKATWSCTSRVTTDYETLKAMKEAGCRLLIVGYESGDPQVLKNIKKGATVEMAERFTANCKKLGLLVHADYIIGLPGESRESIRRTIDFAKRMDTDTIQVSIAHPYPGTEFMDYARKNNLITIDSMTDETGHQLPNVIYPGLDRGELVDFVERFYGEYFFRPRVVWRIVRKAIFDGAERKRLAKEAREYMALRAKRKKFVAEQKAANAGAIAPAESGD